MSVTLTITAASPSATPIGISTVNNPSTPTTVLKVKSLSSESVRVNEITVPWGSEQLPVIEGRFASTSISPSLSRITTGAVRSIGTVALTIVSLPATSVTLMTAVASPSAIVAGITTVNKPPSPTKADKVNSTSSVSVKVTEIKVPCGSEHVPEIIGTPASTSPNTVNEIVGP